MITEEKLCSMCKKNKPRTEYYRNRANPDGLKYSCKECNKIYIKMNKRQVKDSYLKRAYNISLEFYNKILKTQKGVCGICKSEKSKCRNKSSLVVDHCHETKQVRGLLCDNCNKALGLFNDDPEIIINAGIYLIEQRWENNYEEFKRIV